MNSIEGYVIGSLYVLVIILMAWIAAMTWPYWGWKREWLVQRTDNRTLKFFGFLRITLGAFPWQESQRHLMYRTQQNKMSDDIKALTEKYEPRYPIGWKDCGTSLERTLGIQLTSRNVRFDVWIGIIWISWRDFKVAKPKEKSSV